MPDLEEMSEELSEELRSRYPQPSDAMTERARHAVLRAADDERSRVSRVRMPRRRRSLALAIALALLLLGGGTVAAAAETDFPFSLRPAKSPAPPPPAALADSHVTDAQRISGSAGWALTDQLSLTTNSGQSWQDITPEGVDPTTIRAAYFFDADHGWVLTTQMTGPSDNPLGQLVVYYTQDGGQTWQSSDVGSPSASLADDAAGPASFDFLTAQTGWLSVTLPTSGSFSSGLLFATSDGGASWTARTIPIGAPVAFATASDGWTAGGVAGGSAYVTHDGGATWQRLDLPTPSGVTGKPAYAIPDVGPGPASAISATYGASNASLVWFTTSDDGQSFTAETAGTSGVDVGDGTSIDSGQEGSTLVAVLPEAASAIWSASGTAFTASANGLPTDSMLSVTRVSIAPPTEAWAVIGGDACAGDSTACNQFAGLYSTDNAGASWTQLQP